jgi:putative Holliday junction resolvase
MATMILQQQENPTHLPLTTILAIDYGEKFMGLATYNRLNDPFPCPYQRIPMKNQLDKALKELKIILNLENIDTIVLGIPTLLDGKETSMTKNVYQFAQKLNETFPEMPILLQDENLTTFAAKDRMKNSPQYNFEVDLTKIDALSACIILEDFLEKLRRFFLLNKTNEQETTMMYSVNHDE